jgi:hypothetical protein
MRLERTATTVLMTVLAVCAGICVSPERAAADNACKVSLSAGLNNTTPGKVKTKYTFGVAANAAESCADVTFELLVTEQLHDGSTKVVPIPGEMRVRNQTRILAIDYEADARSTIKGFEARMKSCVICEAP